MSVPGAAPPPERFAEGPRNVGPYTLVATIATGRRTTALLGFREGSTDPLVVRELADGVAPERFDAELSAAGALRIGTPLSGSERNDDRLYVEAPVVVGESLATILDQAISTKEPLNLNVALAISMGIAEQLTEYGRVHGDLTPHHVLIGYDGKVTLIDPAGEAHRERAAAPDRRGYRSPEHVNQDPLGPPSDVFLLGVLLFEMTTGVRLFEAETPQDADARIAECNMPRPRDIVGDGYPLELQLVLRKLLRPAMAGRFPDARAAKDALRLVATSRSDVHAGGISRWMEEHFGDRKTAWEELLEPSTDQHASRPSSRADTALTGPPQPLDSGDLGAGDLEEDDSEATQDGPAEPLPRGESGEAIDRELEALESSQKLPAIPAEPTVPNPLPKRGNTPIEAMEVDTFQDLSPARRATSPAGSMSFSPNQITPLDPPRDLPKRKKPQQGLKASPPPSFIPDIPTEVTSRKLDPLSAKVDDSGEPTALDEIEVMDFSQRNLEALTPHVPEPLGLDPPAHTDRAELAPPLADEEEAPEASEPLERPRTPARLTPIPERRDDTDIQPMSPPVAQSDPSHDLISDLWDPSNVESEDEANDTIDESSAADILTPDDLALMQAAAEVMPPPTSAALGHDEPLPELELPPTPTPGPSPVPAAARAAAAAEREKTQPRATLPAAKPSSKPAAAPLAPLAPIEPAPMAPIPPAPLMPEEDLKPNQRGIATQVVRDRIVANSPRPSMEGAVPSSDFSEERAVPTQVVRDREDSSSRPPVDAHRTAAPVLDPMMIEDSQGGGDLVIPLSDDELERSERKKRFAVVGLILAPAMLAAAGFLVYNQFIRDQSAVPITSVPVRPPPARAAPPPPPPPPVPPPGDPEEVEAAPPPPPPPVEPPPPPLVEPPPPPAKAAPAPPPPPPPEPPPVVEEPEVDEPEVDEPEDEEPVRDEPDPVDEPEVAPPPPEPPPAPPPTAEPTLVRVRMLPKEARFKIDGVEYDNGSQIEIGDEPITVEASANGFRPQTKVIRPGTTGDVLIWLTPLKKAEGSEE